jgi:acid phosphatase (class A)
MRGLTDRLVFRGTRSLKGTPRWDLAMNDLDESYAAVLRDFSCAVGGRLTTDNAPRLVTILRHMRNDVVTAVNRPKEHYQRERPFLLDRGDICIERTIALQMSPDYPSGHATWAWSVGLVLAELDPAHATPILARARAFGESRVICGVHNASAIEAARMNASIVVAALHGDPAFRADLESARPEIAALAGSGGLDEAACAAEARLVSKTYW